MRRLGIEDVQALLDQHKRARHDRHAQIEMGGWPEPAPPEPVPAPNPDPPLEPRRDPSPPRRAPGFHELWRSYARSRARRTPIPRGVPAGDRHLHRPDEAAVPSGSV